MSNTDMMQTKLRSWPNTWTRQSYLYKYSATSDLYGSI